MPTNHSPKAAHLDWDRLSVLYEAAMSLPSSRRAAFIESVRAESPELARELIELTALADSADHYFSSSSGRVLQPLFASTLGSLNGDDASDVSTALLPSNIRHYEVRDRLGAGGMGVVHRGWDSKLARDVALKFVHPERLIDDPSRERLLQEARAASSLTHPHVCAVHAVEDLDDGGLCIVMEFCAGGTLQQRLRRGPLPLADALVITRQVASGLALAHRSGIVHRDIKPANIGFDLDGNARILDFGIAQRFHDLSTGATQAASEGSPAGSLPYLAPELLQGNVPDTRCDIWALGITLFQMLSGSRPFTGLDRDQLAQAILHAPLPEISRATSEPVPPTVSGMLHAMLARRPNDRVVDGDALLALLPDVEDSVRALGSGATSATPPTSAESLRAESTRSSSGHFRVRAAVAAFAVLTITLGVVSSASRSENSADTTRLATEPAIELARTGEPLPSLAVLPFSVEGGAEFEYLSHALVDLLTPAFDATGLVRGVDPGAVLGAAPQGPRERIDTNAAQALAVSLGASRYITGSVVADGSTIVVRATLHRATGGEAGRSQIAVRDLAELVDGIDLLVYQLVASELLAPGDTIAGLATTTTHSVPALRAYLDGERELRDARPAAALVHFRQAVSHDSLFALAWYRLARAARWSEVDSVHTLATERANAMSGSLPLRLRSIVRGYYALRVGNPMEAERLLRQATVDYPTDVEAWMLLGETRFHQNPYYGRSSDEALEAFRRVMALDPRHREVNVHLMDLAARNNRIGELDTLFRMYFDPNSAGEQPGIRQTYIALHARLTGDGASASANQFSATEAISDPDVASLALQRLGSDDRERRAARRFAGVLSNAAAATPPHRLDGLLALATLDAVDGFRDSAQLRWRAADSLDAMATLMHRALIAVSPAPIADSANAAAVRDALRRAPVITSVATAERLTAIEQMQVRQYAIGLLSVRLGDLRAAADAENALARSSTESRIAVPLAAALRGHRALARGAYGEARDEFALSVVHLPVNVRIEAPFLEQHADRLAHATAHARAGNADEAARWYESLLDGPTLFASPYHDAARRALRDLSPKPSVRVVPSARDAAR